MHTIRPYFSGAARLVCLGALLIASGSSSSAASYSFKVVAPSSVYAGDTVYIQLLPVLPSSVTSLRIYYRSVSIAGAPATYGLSCRAFDCRERFTRPLLRFGDDSGVGSAAGQRTPNPRYILRGVRDRGWRNSQHDKCSSDRKAQATTYGRSGLSVAYCDPKPCEVGNDNDAAGREMVPTDGADDLLQ